MFLYNIGTKLYFAGIFLFSLFNSKAKSWIQGRKKWKNKLSAILKTFSDYSQRKKIWVHVSSLGEFEQGRPVLEAIRRQYPESYIILSFFSPSGYEVRKNYPLADIVTYLPADTPKNAKLFIELIQPDLVIWVKYDFWYYFLAELKRKNIPTLLISAIFRENSIFEKRFIGVFYRKKVLPCFTHIFVQDTESSDRMSKYYPRECITHSGDTRYDRVLEIAHQPKNLPITRFEGITMVAGSTWPKDEDILSKVYQKTSIPLRLIIAPHEIDENHLQSIEKKFGNETIRYSQYTQKPNAKIIIVDSFGLLSTLYYYGQVAYIGDGFGNHIHNLLEASVYGIPTIFGPKHHKALEASEHIKEGLSKEVHNEQDIIDYLHQIYSYPQQLQEIKKELEVHFERKSGAVQKIMKYIQDNSLLK